MRGSQHDVLPDQHASALGVPLLLIRLGRREVEAQAHIPPDAAEGGRPMGGGGAQGAGGFPTRPSTWCCAWCWHASGATGRRPVCSQAGGCVSPNSRVQQAACSCRCRLQAAAAQWRHCRRRSPRGVLAVDDGRRHLLRQLPAGGGCRVCGRGGSDGWQWEADQPSSRAVRRQPGQSGQSRAAASRLPGSTCTGATRGGPTAAAPPCRPPPGWVSGCHPHQQEGGPQHGGLHPAANGRSG